MAADNFSQDQSSKSKREQKTSAHQQRIGPLWRLVFQSRAGKPRGFLRFWPLWERFTRYLWNLQMVPASRHGLLMLRFMRYRGEPIDLPDGTHVARGDRVGVLHFHNRALLQADRPLSPWEVLKWMREDMHSLAAWQRTVDLKAIYGITLLSRAAPRLGFTLRPRSRNLTAWFDRFFMTGLLVLYHARGLERLAQGTTYGAYPQEAWISLGELRRRYGSRQEEAIGQTKR